MLSLPYTEEAIKRSLPFALRIISVCLGPKAENKYRAINDHTTFLHRDQYKRHFFPF